MTLCTCVCTWVCVIALGRKMLEEITGHLWSLYYALGSVLKHFALAVLFNPRSNIKMESCYAYFINRELKSLAQGPSQEKAGAGIISVSGWLA